MASVLQVNTIKDSGGNATGITVADSSANVTINQLTASTGFPAGHQIGSKILYINGMVSGSISTDQSSFTNSGIHGTYAPKASSSASFLIIEANCSMAYQGTAGGNGQALVTMRTSDTTTYAGGDSIPDKDGYHHYIRFNDTSSYSPYQQKWIYKAGQTGAYPDNLTSYSAGTTYHFRVYLYSSSGTFVYAHVSSAVTLTIQEMML